MVSEESIYSLDNYGKNIIIFLDTENIKTGMTSQWKIVTDD